MKINNMFKDSLINNSIYLMLTSFITSIIGFFFWVIVARYYSTNDIGTASAIFSSISLISMIGSLGLSRSLIFYLPRNKETDKIINSCLSINILSSMMFSLIFILGVKIWTPGLINILNNFEYISVFIIITTFISITGFISATFIAGRRSSFQTINESLFHIIKLVPLIFLTDFGAIGILLSLGIGLFSSIILGFILLHKTWKYIPKLKLDPIVKNMASFSAGNYIADIFYNLPRLLFPILILNMISAKFAGYFYISIMMAGLLYGISQSISSSFLVESSDEDKFSINVNKSIKFNMIILIPGILIFMIFGKFLLNIFNPAYAENATTTMFILTITSLPLSLVNIFNSVKNAQNRVMSMVKMNILISSITIILSILFIKTMNIEGVAISYLIANIIGALIVINRIKSPKEFTLRLLSDIKSDISYFNY